MCLKPIIATLRYGDDIVCADELLHGMRPQNLFVTDRIVRNEFRKVEVDLSYAWEHPRPQHAQFLELGIEGNG